MDALDINITTDEDDLEDEVERIFEFFLEEPVAELLASGLTIGISETNRICSQISHHYGDVFQRIHYLGALKAYCASKDYSKIITIYFGTAQERHIVRDSESIKLIDFISAVGETANTYYILNARIKKDGTMEPFIGNDEKFLLFTPPAHRQELQLESESCKNMLQLFNETYVIDEASQIHH